MKRFISVLLSVFLLLSIAIPAYAAAEKKQTTRAIAIVFDNSGSMYVRQNQAWCRATYAMEVFASMLNDGDTLMIYPMHPIEVDGKEYSQSTPLKITDPKQSSQIRKIYTDDPQGTPIECLDAAAQGLRGAIAEEKWLIVLTDGDTFDQNGVVFSDTARELGNHINTCIGDMNVMFLGIGKNATLPTGVDSDHFTAEKASDSKDVLSALTKMCNQIFGRDTLPASRNNNGALNFDISMKKLIVFVQGENVSTVSVTGHGGAAGTLVSSSETKYATDGCNKAHYVPVSDTSLQGVLVTYENCPAGEYTVNYSGTATSIEVYYEPDADLDFVFTNERGVAVDPDQSLYGGKYKVSYGIKDAKTGQLIDSDLLGEPVYNGLYSLDGNKGSGNATSIQHKGMSGEEPVTLKIGDIFYARMTVTYLSGYTITKESIDFGWPELGLPVVEIPPETLELKINPPAQTTYRLPTLEDGPPYTAEIFYGGEKLEGPELEKVELKWDPDTSNAEIMQAFAGDHYDLTMHYKDPSQPTSTVCGPCTVSIYAFYTAPGSGESTAEMKLSYMIEDTFGDLNVNLTAPQDYYILSELEDGEILRADITLDGAKLSDEELAAVDFSVVCEGLNFEQVVIPGESAYAIKMLPTDNVKTGRNKIMATTVNTDEIGRTTSCTDSVSVEIATIPAWLRNLLIILAILLLLGLLLLFLNTKVLPKSIVRAPETDYNIGGKTIDDTATVKYSRSGKSLQITPPDTPLYSYVNCAAKLDLKPVSPRRVPSAKRKAEVIKVHAGEGISSVEVGAATYERDETGAFVKEGNSATVIGKNSVITINGIATTANNKKKPAILSQQLIYK